MSASYRPLRKTSEKSDESRCSEESILDLYAYDVDYEDAHSRCLRWSKHLRGINLILFLGLLLSSFVTLTLLWLLSGQDKPQAELATEESFHGLLRTEDVVITLKSGASVIHQRLPVHFDNEFSADSSLPRTSNLILYSDAPDIIRGHTIVDALANVSDVIRKQKHFQPYFSQEKQLAQGLPVDPSDKWQLDKYKFMPLLRHAYTAYPDAKWYINIEADTYLFYPALMRLLDSLSSSAQVMLGNSVYDDEKRLWYCHGGSGYVISQGLMSATYGSDPAFERRLEGYSEWSCCGDEILGRALWQDHEGKRIRLKGPDPATESGFYGETPYELQFTSDNWCDPIYTFHHVKPKHIEELWTFEQSIWPRILPGDTIRKMDVFDHFQWDFMKQGRDVKEVVREGWANGSGDIAVQPEEGVKYDEAFCSFKCAEDERCWAWQLKQGECSFAKNSIKVGDYDRSASSSQVSGVRMDRIKAFKKAQRCEGRPMRAPFGRTKSSTGGYYMM